MCELIVRVMPSRVPWLGRRAAGDGGRGEEEGGDHAHVQCMNHKAGVEKRSQDYF